MEFVRIKSRIYLEYDPATDPLMLVNISNAIRLLDRSKTWKALLRGMQFSRTGYRPAFCPKKANAIIKQPLKRKFSTTLNDPSKKILTLGAKTSAQEENSAAAKNGTGSVCWVNWSNKEFKASPAHIAIAHELIHAYHSLRGQMNADNKVEEYTTVGIHGHETTKICESRICHDLNMVLRAQYFGDELLTTLRL